MLCCSPDDKYSTGCSMSTPGVTGVILHTLPPPHGRAPVQANGGSSPHGSIRWSRGDSLGHAISRRLRESRENAAASSRTDALNRIWDECRRTPGLHCYIDELMGIEPPLGVTPVFRNRHQQSQELCLTLQLVQLMEDVFLHLELEDFGSTQIIEDGPSCLCGGRSPRFRRYWAQIHRTFGIRFEIFFVLRDWGLPVIFQSRKCSRVPARRAQLVRRGWKSVYTDACCAPVCPKIALEPGLPTRVEVPGVEVQSHTWGTRSVSCAPYVPADARKCFLNL